MNSNHQDPEESKTSGKSSGDDLPDSPHDEARMQPEEIIFDLPEVKDIPGQEHVQVPGLGELADTTISSDDEEGIGLFDDEDDSGEEDTEIIMGTEADAPAIDRQLLQKADEVMPGEEEKRLQEATLDHEDEDGEPLNEGSSSTDISGDDLDTSGIDEDDPNESIGEEDEENNAYSVSDNEEV